MGHRGIKATLRILEAFFYWTALKRAAEAFVRDCIDCQKEKFDRVYFILHQLRKDRGRILLWTLSLMFPRLGREMTAYIDRFSKSALFILVKKNINVLHTLYFPNLRFNLVDIHSLIQSNSVSYVVSSPTENAAHIS